MRRFFSLRSTLSSDGNDTTAPSDLCKSKKRVNSVVPVEKDVINSAIGHVHCDLKGPKDSFLKPRSSYMEKKDSSNPHLRRSLSFSSLDIHVSENEDNVSSLNGQSKLNYYLDDDKRVGRKYSLHESPFNPESYGRSKTVQDEFLQSSKNVKVGSPSPSGSYTQSSGNSACSSPIPLRCRATRLSKDSGQNKVVDLYIDQEHHPSKTNASCQNFDTETGDGVCFAERVELPSSERPPRAICKIPSSFNYNAASIRSCSFREIMNKPNDHSGKEWIVDDAKPDIQGSDSQTTTTVEDIYEDSSDGGPILNSNFPARECALNLIPPSKEFGCNRRDVPFDLPMKVGFPGGDLRETEYEGLVKSIGKERDSDEWLFKKVKELEECYNLFLSVEDPECDKFQHGSLSTSDLFQNIRKISEDRRNLASELCLQIRSRLAERSSANCRSKQSKLELDTRTRRLEKEKNDILLSLKKELDRRSNEWSSMLLKLQTEEQRLRERARELAEQNVSLQREVASLKSGQVEAKNSIGNLEKQLNDSRANKDELKAENYNLRQAILELQERCNRAEEEQNRIRNVSMEKEKENRDLQKLIAKFQRGCSEQEKTICELRQSYDIEIGKKFVEGDNVVVHLQTEQLRLTGVELKLRRELDSCRVELDSLRKENIGLFDRLQSTGNKCSVSLIKLDQEVHAWIECLQLKGLSLLDDSSHLCEQLLDFVGQKQSDSFSEFNLDSAVNSVAELTSRYHKIRKAIENFRRSLQVVSTSLNEKSGIQAVEGMCSNSTTFSSRQEKVQKLEDEVEAELKAEFILTRLLREKIYSREVEIEQLHEDLAASIRNQDLLSAEIQRLQDEVSCLTHKKKDMEIQGLKKDENVSQLQRDLQECMKDLAAERSTLRSVSKERDQMWEEVKGLRESNMLMNCELKSLHKKVEVLDEDILYRDGQICILKESLENRPFNFICSPTTMKEFNMQ